MDGSLPSDWRAKRRDILERDSFTCGNCGKTPVETDTHLHVHHVVPRFRGGTHNPSNLITLCERCHRAVHSSNVKAPTAGPTIDYDRVVDILQNPPDQWSDDDEDHINKISQVLDEYAGGDIGAGAQYYPNPSIERKLSLSESAALYSSQDTPDNQRWEHLSAKWTQEL